MTFVYFFLTNQNIEERKKVCIYDRRVFLQGTLNMNFLIKWMVNVFLPMADEKLGLGCREKIQYLRILF